MICKNCNSINIRKKGSYKAKGLKVQRFQCKACFVTFTNRTNTRYYCKKKQYLASKMLHMYCEGMSLRAISRVLNVNRKTVSQYFIEASNRAEIAHLKTLKGGDLITQYVQFDEMEAFEGGKKYPLGIELAVRVKTGQIISARVARIPIKAQAVSQSARIEAKRIADRPQKMTEMMLEMDKVLPFKSLISCDHAKINISKVKEILPQHKLKTHQGTSKELWRVNYTCLKLRQDISRLRRSTLATTKKKENLQRHLDLYIAYNNKYGIF